MPISSQALRHRTPPDPPPLHDLFEASRRMSGLAVLHGQEASPKFRSPAKRTAVRHFKSAAQGTVMRALEAAGTVSARHTKRNALDHWWWTARARQRDIGNRRLGAIMGREVLLKERVLQTWRGLSRFEFTLWVREHQSHSRRMRRMLLAGLHCWRMLTARMLQLETLRRVICSHADRRHLVKVVHGWRQWAAIKAGVVVRAENSCRDILLRVLMAWRAKLCLIYRKRIRILKGAIILRVVDMRSISWAFSEWRAVRENYRQQVRIGVFISAIVNKAVRVMLKGCLNDWRVLVRSGLRLQVRMWKLAKRIQLERLGQCMFVWTYCTINREKTRGQKEAHVLLVKIRVLQSWFRLTKIVKRLRLRSIYFRQLAGWNSWVELVRENQRLRLQLPYRMAEVTPSGGEIRHYRLLDAYFFLQARDFMGRIFSVWVSVVDEVCRRRHVRAIVSTRSIRRFGHATLECWLHRTRWKKLARERVNLLECKHNLKCLHRSVEAWSRWVYFQRLVISLRRKLTIRRRLRALQDTIWTWALRSQRTRLLTIGSHIVEQNWNKLAKKSVMQILKKMCTTRKALEFSETIEYAYFKPRESSEPHVRCKLWLAATKCPEYLGAAILARWKLRSWTTPRSLLRLGFACWISETIALRPMRTLSQGLYLRKFVERPVSIMDSLEWRTKWKAFKKWARNSRQIRRQKNVVSAYCLRALMHEAARVLICWRSLVDTEICFRSRISSAANMLLVRHAHQARMIFLHWLLFLQNQGRHGMLMQGLTERGKRTIIQNYFVMWRARLTSDKHMNSLSIRLGTRKNRAIRFNVFWKWKDRVRTVRKIHSAVQRKEMQSQLIAYVALLNYAGRNRCVKAVSKKLNLNEKYRTFGQWAMWSSERVTYRKVICKKMVKQHARRQAANTAAVWIWQVQLALTRRSRVEWALRKLRARSLQEFVTLWLTAVQKAYAARSLRYRIRLRGKYNCQEAVFHQLHLRLIHRRRLKLFCKHVVAVRLILFLRMWKGLVSETWRLTLAATKVRYHAISSLIYDSFQKWNCSLYPDEDGPDDEMMAVALHFDESFPDTIEDPSARNRFEAKVIAHVAATINVEASKIQVLCHQRGSVITEVLVPSDPWGGQNRRSHVLAKKLERSINERANAAARRSLSFGGLESPQRWESKLKGATVHGKLPKSIYQALQRSASALPHVDQCAMDKKMYHIAKMVNRIEMRHRCREFFVRWRASTRETLQRKKRLKILYFRIHNLCLVNIYNEWAHYKHVMKRMRQKTKKCLLKLMFGCLVMTFELWSTNANEQIRMKKKMKMVVYRLKQSAMVKSYHAWQTNTKTNISKRKKLKRAAMKMFQGALTRSFERWAEHVEEETEMKQKLKRAAMKMFQGALTRSFERWAEHMNRERKMKQTLKRAAMKMFQGALTRSFERWAEHVEEEKELKQKLKRAAMKMFQGALTRSFERWAEHVEEEKEMKQKLKRAAMKMFQGALTRSFERWAEHVEEEKEMKQKLKRAAMKMFQGALTRSFERWAEHVEEEKEMKQTLKRAAMKMFQGALTRSFERWAEHVEEEKEMKQTLKRAAMKMFQGALTRSFERWAEHVEEEKELKQKLKRAAMKMFQGALTRSFERWAEHVEEEKEMKQTLKRAAMKMFQGALTRSFERWAEHVEEEKEMKQKLKRAAMKMFQGALTRSFERWAEHVEEEKELKQTLKRAAMKMFQGALTRSFERWAEHVEEEKEMKQKLKRAAMKMFQGALIRSFERWAEHVEEEKEMKQTLKRAAMKMFQGALTRSFERWAEHVEEEKEMKQKLKRAAMKMFQGALTRSFERWAEHVEEEKEMKQKLKRAAMKMFQGALTRSFERWAEHVEEEKEMKQTLKRAAMKMFQGALTRSFERWAEHVEEEKEMKQTLKRAAMKMFQGALTRSFERWAEHVEEEKEMKQTLKRAAMKMFQGALTRSFERWAEHVEEEKEMKQTLKRAAMKMFQGALTRSFERWAEHVEEEKEMKQKLKRAAMKMFQGALTRSFERWAEHVEEEKEMKQTLKRAAMKMFQGALTRSFERWAEHVEEEKEMKQKLKRAAMKMFQGALTRSFERWAEHVEEEKEMKQTLKRAAMKMFQGALTRSFERWAEHVEEEKEMKQTLKRAAMKMFQGALTRSFERWAEHVEEEKEMKQKLKRAAMKMFQGALTRSFERWAEHVEEEKELKQTLKRAAMKMFQGALTRSFERWAEHVEEEKELKQKLKRAAMKMFQGALTRSFERWAEHVEEEKEMKQKLKRAAMKMFQGALTRSFERWAEHVEEEKEMKQKLKRAAMKMFQGALTRSFERWAEHVEEEKEMKQTLKRAAMKMFQFTLSRAFCCWISQVWQMQAERADEDRRLHLVRLSVKRMLNGVLSAAFMRWTLRITELKRYQYVMNRVLRHWTHRTTASALERWQDCIRIRRQHEAKTMKIMLRMMKSGANAAFDTWTYWVREHKRIQNVAKRVVCRMRKKGLTLSFDFWRGNVRSLKQLNEELGQKTRYYLAAVQSLQGRRKALLRWKYVITWKHQVCVRGFKEFELMCDKMGDVIDARSVKKCLDEWRRISRNVKICRYVVEERSARQMPNLLQVTVFEWHSLAAVESRRRQTIAILRSRLPRRVIAAWTHSFAWRRCVESRSIRMSKICARKYIWKMLVVATDEWRNRTIYHRKCRRLSKFWVLKFIFKWFHYRAEYKFHRNRAMSAPHHEKFVEQLRRPMLAGKDRVQLAYTLAGRVLGDLSLVIQSEPNKLDDAQSVYSRAWLFVNRYNLADLRPVLQELDARVLIIGHNVEALTDVGITIGSRIRVSWSIKVKKQLSPQAFTSNDASETWTDIWWGCTVLNRAEHTEKERTEAGHLLWNVIYDPLPANLNSYPSEARKMAFLSSKEVLDSEAGRLRWKKESDFFVGNTSSKAKGSRPGLWPPTVDWIMQQVESVVFSQSYDYQPSWWQDALQALAKVRLQTVASSLQDDTKREYPVEYLILDARDGLWKSPADLGTARIPWRGRKRFMRLVELRLNPEELVDEFQVLEEWCRLDTTKTGFQAARKYLHGEEAWQEAQISGKVKGRNVAKRVVDWVHVVEDLAKLRIEDFDPLCPENLQVKFSEMGENGEWHMVTIFDQSRQKRIRGHSVLDFKLFLLQRLKQHVETQRQLLLDLMLKEEATKSKKKINEDESIELSTSPFEQKFADLRPTNSPVSAFKVQPFTPKQPAPRNSFRQSESRFRVSSSVALTVKRELSEIFEDCYDAWMFLDTKQSFSVDSSQLSKGLQRLGIGVNVTDLVKELDKDVYDGVISIREFIRGIAWHPVPSDPSVLNRVLDAAMRRREATEHDALRTATWRMKNNAVSPTKASPKASPKAFTTPGSTNVRSLAGAYASELRSAVAGYGPQSDGSTSTMHHPSSHADSRLIESTRTNRNLLGMPRSSS